MNHCDPYLCHHSFFTGTREAFNLQILFDPFEKQFDLPPLLVDYSNIVSIYIEMVIKEYSLLVVLIVKLPTHIGRRA